MSGEKLICQQPQTLTAFEKTPKKWGLGKHECLEINVKKPRQLMASTSK